MSVPNSNGLNIQDARGSNVAEKKVKVCPRLDVSENDKTSDVAVHCTWAWTLIVVVVTVVVVFVIVVIFGISSSSSRTTGDVIFSIILS